MQQAADEATAVTRLGTDGLKVSKQRPPVMMAKGTPPLKQIPGYTLWSSAKSFCTVRKHLPAVSFHFLSTDCQSGVFYGRFGRQIHH
jgi:hypothetical protein